MRGHLRLWLERKDGGGGMAFEHEVIAEPTEDGLKLFDEHGDLGAYLYDVEIVQCLRAADGDLPLACYMLTELINSKFEQWN